MQETENSYAQQVMRDGYAQRSCALTFFSKQRSPLQLQEDSSIRRMRLM